MAGDGSPLQFVHLLGILLAFLCLIAAYRAGKRGRLIDNLPTSKTTGVFIGLVELKGTAETSGPLTSYLAGMSCVYHAWTVEERWSRTVSETYTDSDGKSHTRTRHESGWTKVVDGGEMIPFFVQDDCGIVLVQPEGARVEPVTVFRETCGPGDPVYYAKGPPGAISSSDHVRRFNESAIPLHAELYVMGQARERADVVAAEIAADKDAALFLISTRTEEQVSRGFSGSFWGWGIAGCVLVVLGFVVSDLASQLRAETRWPVYVLAALGYLLCAAVGWTWLAFNGLVELRQRVRQAWAQVEIQLKRRHDLIPNLVEIVKGQRDHEQQTQTELAALRTQLQATAPGVAGPDFRALKGTVLALAERYPNLKADSAFAQLQRQLIDTEQRIALARGYFNEIATHFNTRLETVPEKLVARLGAMQHQTLFAAQEFERAPVKVEWTS